MIKLIIFDMDGTLIDSDEVLIKTREELFRLYKDDGSSFNPNKISEYSGPPLDYAIHDAFPEKDKEFIRKEYRVRTKKYYDIYLKSFKNSVKAIRNFKENNIILAILTTKNLEMTSYCLKKFHLFKYFSDLITLDSPFPLKPSPLGINYLKDKYNLKDEEVLMVGDTSYDALAAKNANIKSCIMLMRERNNLNAVKIDYFAHDYNELIKIINDLNEN